jgi:transcriptional regulator GlxA family with amidase domain
MLRETGRSVADVALAVGYAESASFSRAFTRHFGQGPRASRD